MAMMNALDSSSQLSTAPGHSASAVNNSATLNQPQSKMTDAGRDTAAGFASSADVSVTPVRVSNVPISNHVPSPPVNKDPTRGVVLERDGSAVCGALAELHQLRGSLAARRFLHVPPASTAHAPVGKENRENDRPFGSLLESLRRLNPELGAGCSGRSVLPSVSAPPFQLLCLPDLRGNEFPVKLPSVASSSGPVLEPAPPRSLTEGHRLVPAVADHSVEASACVPSSEFPLLHISKDPFPAANTPSSDGLPFLMLRMVDPRQGPVPFFVSPENITGNNNHHHKTSTARSVVKPAWSEAKIERYEAQSGSSAAPNSSQRSVELLQLQSSSGCDSYNSRQVSLYVLFALLML